MDSLKQFNIAMSYIEEHLTEQVDVQQIARLARCSQYHFKRMFSSLSGYSLGEYIRLRRLTLAGLELCGSEKKVIDIAVKYGYESSDAFTRAFHAFHGLTPSEARNKDALLKAIPPMTFQLTIRGGTMMQYRIVEKEAFSIVGVKQRVKMIFEGENPQIAQLAQSLTAEDIAELKGMSNIEPKGLLSVSANFEERTLEGSELDQYLGVATTQQAPDRWACLPVEASTWAVFTAVGSYPKALQDTWARIYSEWLPGSGYELTGGPEILWNEGADISKANYKSEIWIPVVKQIH